MKNTIYINQLISFYGSLLTLKQLEYLEDYYYNDLSFSEIAENKEVSRNAVFKNIKNSVLQLEKYEEKLRFIAKIEKIRKSSLKKDEIIKILES